MTMMVAERGSINGSFSQVSAGSGNREAFRGRATTLPRVEGTHLSPRAHQRLQDELAWRSSTRRTEISQWLERAREHGDIRENADYDAAKNEQGHNEARIRHLDALLKSAVIVEGTPDDVVAPGVVVSI